MLLARGLQESTVAAGPVDRPQEHGEAGGHKALVLNQIPDAEERWIAGYFFADC